MKLRIQDNTLRFRLSQGDLAELMEKGWIEERLQFGPLEEQQFVYSLESVERSEQMAALYHSGRLTVLVPGDWTDGWAESDREGFEGTYTSRDGQHITLLVEKDLECRHKDTPEGANAFPR